ncbi:MAG: hypothetical protein C4525_08095 [Desulfarculus sp.]|nr:MAG: hypothetical protein C4525_08095 [Desulfarculus sp.]
MKPPADIITRRCQQCGRPVERPGLCEACQGQPACGGGRWKDCTPAMPDCDCPIIGYAKLHVPGCKYF